MSLRRGSNVVLTAAAICIVGASVKFSAPFLVPVVLAGFIATVTAPFVLWLMDHRVPRWVAVFFGVSLDLLGISFLGLLVGGSMNGFFERVPFYEERAFTVLESASAGLAAVGIDISVSSLVEIVDPVWLMGTFGEVMRRLASVISQILLVMLIVVFMLIEATALRAKLELVLTDVKDIERLRLGTIEIKKYVLVKTFTSGLTGLLAGLLCWALGLDLPILWGLVAFLLNYIPTVGSIIASIFPMALALLQLGPGTMLLVGAGYLAINFSIGNGIEPRMMGRALGLSPMVVFLSMVVWGWFLGPVGALLSAPLTMIGRQWLAHTEDWSWIATLLGPSPDPKTSTELRKKDEERRLSERPPPNVLREKESSI